MRGKTVTLIEPLISSKRAIHIASPFFRGDAPGFAEHAAQRDPLPGLGLLFADLRDRAGHAILERLDQVEEGMLGERDRAALFRH